MRNPDRYTSTSDSHEEDDSRDEDRGRPAQAMHGTITRHAVEYIPAPPAREHPPIVPIPRFEGTLVIPHDNLEKPAKPVLEAEDEDDEDDEDQDKAQQAAAVPPQAAPAQPRAEDYQWAADVNETELADSHMVEHPPADAPDSETGEPPFSDAEADMPQPVPPSQHIEQPGLIPQYTAEAQHWASASSGTTPPVRPPAARAFTPPPIPPSPANTGGQPPMPPIDRPPISPDYGYPNPNAPMPSSASFNTAPMPHPVSYDQAPTPPVINNHNVQPPYIPRSDNLARLGVVGNFIGNRRTRKRLGRKIDQHHQESSANFADIQSQQLRFEQQQRNQDRELYNLRSQVQNPAERTPAAAPLTAGNSHAEAMPAIGRTPDTQPARLSGERLVPLPPITEQRPPTPAEELQSVELRPDEHVKQSAWHNIVVNERGKEVEGVMHYGEGFRKERQQEIIRDRTTDKAAAVSLGGMAVGSPVGGQYGGGSQPYGGLPSGMTAPGSQSPAHVDPQHQLPEGTKKDSGIPGPVFWVMLLVIVAAFFAAALI